MKLLLYLTATFAVCNAGILGGFGGNSIQEVQVQPQQLHHVQSIQHVASVPQQVKIIKIQSGGGYSGGSNEHYGGYTGGYDHGHGQPHIIKVLDEQSHRYSDGHSHGYGHGHVQSYAPSYSSYSLQSILPHILKLILADSGSSGGYAHQLVDIYGNSGRAVVNRNGNSANYLGPGHVVEKGHIEILRIDRQNGGGGGSSGGGGLGSLFGGKG